MGVRYDWNPAKNLELPIWDVSPMPVNDAGNQGLIGDTHLHCFLFLSVFETEEGTASGFDMPQRISNHNRRDSLRGFPWGAFSPLSIDFFYDTEELSFLRHLALVRPLAIDMSCLIRMK